MPIKPQVTGHIIRWATSATCKKGCRGRVCDERGSEFGVFAQVEIDITHQPRPSGYVLYHGRFIGLSDAARRFLHEHHLNTLRLEDYSLAQIKVKAWKIVGGGLVGKPSSIAASLSTNSTHTLATRCLCG